MAGRYDGGQVTTAPTDAHECSIQLTICKRSRLLRRGDVLAAAQILAVESVPSAGVLFLAHLTFVFIFSPLSLALSLERSFIVLFEGAEFF